MLVIGDVHGMLDRYIDLVIDHEGPTLQLGDMGFDYDELSVLDHHQHKFFGGNHDNYDKIGSCPHALGDFGMWHADKDIFYARGAWSIDWQHRTEGVDIWAHKEQLSYNQALACLDCYSLIKPNIVITHDCPQFLHTELFKYHPVWECNTTLLFEQMWIEHQPELWLFGHHHKNVSYIKGKTLFQCLGELSTTEI